MSVQSGNDRAPDGAGHDAFLDVVTNIVGIMIILIAVAGLRVQEYARFAVSSNVGASGRELDAALAEEASLKDEMANLKLQAALIQQEHAARAQERHVFLTQITLARAQLDAQAADATASSARVQALEHRLAGLAGQIEDVARRRDQLAAHKPNTLTIENLPSPLATTVTGKEAHYQLRNGRVTHIPLDDLVELFKQDAMGRLGQARSRGQVTQTVGPLGGFRLAYTLVHGEAENNFGVAASVVRLEKWQLIPVAPELGETADEALAPYSGFRRSLERYKPDTTITLWTYPDSFALFRALKRELFAKGYDAAARPLPQGYPISGSPSGSRSSAQ